MMNKRSIRHILKRLSVVNVWYFVVAIAVVGAVALVSLRQNSIRSVELRDTVLKVDEQNGDVEAALRDLRSHIYGHMNSSLAVPGGSYPPVQLKYRYERLAAAEKEQVSQANAKLYTEAQGYCEAAIPAGRSLNRIDCIQDYVTSRGGATEKAIPDSLYKFDFASPVWSPDLAGWSLVLLGVLGILFGTWLIATTWLKHSLHQ